MKGRIPGVRRFRTALRQFERIVNAHSKSCCSQVTAAQCHVLLHIADSEPTTTNELTHILNLNASTVSRTVDGLVRAKLVMRAENPEDRRSALLRLTSKGRALSDRINADADAVFSRVIDHIPPDERAFVLRSFETLVRAFIDTTDFAKRSTECKQCRC